MNYLPAGHSPHYRLNFSIIAVDVLDHQSLGVSFQTPICFFDNSNRYSYYSIAFWTVAIENLNQQSIISTIAIDNLNHQSIISITVIDIFNHQSINSTIAIDFCITSRELIPLLTDMASHRPGFDSCRLCPARMYHVN